MGLNIITTITNTVSASQPSSASKGDTWYDTTTNSLKIYNGSTWATSSPDGTQPIVLERRTSDPASPAVGQIWIRTDL